MALIILQWIALLGIILSIYFFHVSRRHSLDKKYKPICDVTKTVSCSKAAKSQYSKIFVIHNSVLGFFFYLAVFLLSFFALQEIILSMAILASLFSLYLIYISFNIRVACPVCILTYIVNFSILYFTFSKFI